MPTRGLIITRGGSRGAALFGSLLLLAGCAPPLVSPILPPPYRGEVPASYDDTWRALVRALARENFPLRAVARDSGVIATDEVVTPIGLYADCGSFGSDRVEGEALVSFTVFAQANADGTEVQINSKMRTQAHRRGSSGKLFSAPVFPCASTGRFEANLLDAVRAAVKP
jgi:hypothetical protein